MTRKSDVVRAYVKCGRIKEALRVAKTFRLGITRDQAEAMCWAYECIVHPKFYAEIGIDVAEKVKAGTAVLQSLYGSK